MYKCNHEPGTHEKQAGGRGADGKFKSGDAAAYPRELILILARAFTVARTGSSEPVADQTAGSPREQAAAPDQGTPPQRAADAWWQGQPTLPPSTDLTSIPSHSPSPSSADQRRQISPIAFPQFPPIAAPASSAYPKSYAPTPILRAVSFHSLLGALAPLPALKIGGLQQRPSASSLFLRSNSRAPPVELTQPDTRHSSLGPLRCLLRRSKIESAITATCLL